MRTRYNRDANNIIDSFERYIEDSNNLQEIINKYKNKKVYLEIGMGKGDFITNMANDNPDNIYIGVELSRQVLSLAIKKLKRYESDNNLKLNNLFFMSFDAINVTDYFKEGQVDTIFLNFSDPWPKKRHTKRRLTYKTFLEVYKEVLKENGIIEFKTDNRGLFEYSLVSMQNFGMHFIEVYLDLHKSNVLNVETEYEKKFSPYGPIYKLVAKF